MSAEAKFPEFLKSSFFNIICPLDATYLYPDGTSPTSKEATFYVHKELLRSLSPELEKHVKNEMKEGLTDKMVLKDVDVEILERFLEWAYTGDYPDTGPKSVVSPLLTAKKARDAAEMLPIHARLYILADRFNVKRLKALVYSRITTLLPSLDRSALKEDKDIAGWVVSGIRYCFENLPATELLRTDSTPTSAAKSTTVITNTTASDTHDGAALLSYLSRYCAWELESLKKNAEFRDFVGNCLDFAMALVDGCKPADAPPWVASPLRAKCGGCHNLFPQSTKIGQSVYCSNCGNTYTTIQA